MPVPQAYDAPLRRAFVHGFIAVAAVAALPAWAGPLGTVRSDLNIINPGDAYFDGASYSRTANISLTAGSGNGSQTLTIVPLATAITFFGTGGVGVSPSGAASGTTSAVVNLTVPATGTGLGWGFSIQAVASTLAGQSSLTQSWAGAVNQLTWSKDGTGLVATGGTFIETTEILGDWSAASAHTAATYSSGYSLLSNFVFNGTYTVVSVQTTNYQGTGPLLSFTLETVPEPASMALLGAGCAALLGVARRRRRAPAA
jgi:hypothetical protein